LGEEQQKKKKRKPQLILLKQEEIQSETFQELMAVIEEPRNDGKYVDVQICPRCKSAKVKESAP
jgi:hypothetical protein